MKEFVLDASFALRWCFEDETTAYTESILKLLEDQEALAWVPDIWRYEILNALRKAIKRERLTQHRALLLWQEIQALPIRVIDVAVDEKLLEVALKYDLAVYDASYLLLADSRRIELATVDGKLLRAAAGIGIKVIRP